MGHLKVRMNEEKHEKISLKVAEKDGHLERLDRFLTAQLPEFSRSRIQAWIRQGSVSVNQTVAKARTQLMICDEVSMEIPKERATETLEPEPIPLSVLYEDDFLLVIDKAEGMVVHPGSGVDSGTLVNALLSHCEGRLSTLGGEDRPGIVHRLDKDTSGCLVAAKDNETHAALSAAFAAREVHKDYLCFVAGSLKRDSGSLQNFIGRNPGNRQKMAIVEEHQGKPAHTDYAVLGRSAATTAVHCRIHTGRTHQIRVHMAYGLGHPILGDVIYGRRTLKHRDAHRLMLHAWKLAFSHPRTGETLALVSPLPESMERLLTDPGFTRRATFESKDPVGD